MFSVSEMYLGLKEDNAACLLKAFSEGVSPDATFPKHWHADAGILKNSPPLLSVAAFYRSESCVRTLIAHGANVMQEDADHVTVGMFAVAGGSMPIIHLFDDHRVSFDGALRVAAGYGRFDVFCWLYAAKDPEMDFVSPSRKTILHYAAKGGNPRIIDFILRETEIDVNAKTEFVCFVFNWFVSALSDPTPHGCTAGTH
jgi:ankyrin repeat protein